MLLVLFCRFLHFENYFILNGKDNAAYMGCFSDVPIVYFFFLGGGGTYAFWSRGGTVLEVIHTSFSNYSALAFKIILSYILHFFVICNLSNTMYILGILSKVFLTQFV